MSRDTAMALAEAISRGGRRHYKNRGMFPTFRSGETRLQGNLKRHTGKHSY